MKVKNYCGKIIEIDCSDLDDSILIDVLKDHYCLEQCKYVLQCGYFFNRTVESMNNNNKVLEVNK